MFYFSLNVLELEFWAETGRFVTEKRLKTGKNTDLFVNIDNILMYSCYSVSKDGAHFLNAWFGKCKQVLLTQYHPVSALCIQFTALCIQLYFE